MANEARGHEDVERILSQMNENLNTPENVNIGDTDALNDGPPQVIYKIFLRNSSRAIVSCHFYM